MKIRLVGVQLFIADALEDRHDETDGRFPQISRTRPNNYTGKTFNFILTQPQDVRNVYNLGIVVGSTAVHCYNPHTQ